MKPYVVVCCPSRNRAWSLSDWYKSLAAQTRPPDAVYVLLNDNSADDSMGLLQSIQDSASLPDLEWDHYFLGGSGFERVATETTPRYDINNLATLRNLMIANVLTTYPQATHLWSVDSDVAADPNVLDLLLSASQPIVAAVVRNSTGPVFNFGLGRDEFGPRRNGDEIGMLETADPFTVTYTGACVLMTRKVAETVKYEYHRRGEDVLWSQQAWGLGYGIFVHPLARTDHKQKDGSIWR